MITRKLLEEVLSKWKNSNIMESQSKFNEDAIKESSERFSKWIEEMK